MRSFVWISCLLPELWIFIFIFEKCQNLFSWSPPFGPFWSVKCLNIGGESCEIRILSHPIQEIYILRKVKNQVLLFQSSWEPNLPDLMVYTEKKQNPYFWRNFTAIAHIYLIWFNWSYLDPFFWEAIFYY